MNMLNKEPERFDIEALLPWHAAGTLSRRDADRVEQALASDRELQRRYALVREEFAETIHLNESLGAPSARAMEKLFAAIDAEEARTRAAARRSISPAASPSSFRLRAAHAGLGGERRRARDPRAGSRDHHRGGQGPDVPGAIGLANKPSDGSFAMVSFAAQATAADITNFLGAHKASMVEDPSRAASTRSSSLTASLRPTRSARSSSRCRKSRRS